MMFFVELRGLESLERELQRLNTIRFDSIVTKNLTQMFNRGKSNTPVSTEYTRPGSPHGELRQSLSKSKEEVGYTKDYAPHVEYGHRIVRGGKQVGYVEGQYFLKKNLDIQRDIYREDLIKGIEGK